MSVTEEQLAALVDEIVPRLRKGRVSTYLSRLAEAEVDDLAVAVDTGAGEVVSAGRSGVAFTTQSVVKVFTLLLALRDRGDAYVFERVGQDQTSGTFDSFDTIDRSTGRPANPFVNSGALTVVGMLKGADPQEKVTRVLALVRHLADNPDIKVDLDVAKEEFACADRNRAIGYFLRSCGLVADDVDDLLWAYCQMCAIQVKVADLARAGAVLARDSSIRAVDDLPAPEAVREVRRLMLTTGMYAASGWYARKVGIPAKCGVSGAMLGIVPEVGGIGVYGPSLDDASNSVGGILMMRALAERFGIA